MICKHCENEFENTLQSCPVCGCPATQNPQPVKRPHRQHSQQNNDEILWKKIIAILLAFLVVVSTFAIVLSIKNKQLEDSINENKIINKTEKAPDKPKADTSPKEESNKNEENNDKNPLAIHEIIEEINNANVGETVIFGSYPQTKVVDPVLREALAAEESSIKWDNIDYVGNLKEKYIDIVLLNGKKYRVIKSDSGEITWYEFAPLIWKVLDPENGLIICQSVIDTQPFDIKGNSNYAESSIREWLNEDFYDCAFASKDKTVIKNNPEISNDKLEKNYIFLLTENDFNKYLAAVFKDGFANVTDYANGEQNTIWWLRESKTTNTQQNVSPTSPYGVRPALYIEINK